MELTTIRKKHVPEYLRISAFFLALDDEEDEEFSIATSHLKSDTVISDEDSLRNLLYTLRFWGVDTIPTSVYDAAFDEDCRFFVSVASEFTVELHYLDELIQLRSLPLEKRLEHACKNGNLQMVRSLISGNSVNISGNCLEAAASGGHLHCIQFLHALRGRRHWNRIANVAAIYVALSMSTSTQMLSLMRRTVQRHMDTPISYDSLHTMAGSWTKSCMRPACHI